MDSEQNFEEEIKNTVITEDNIEEFHKGFLRSLSMCIIVCILATPILFILSFTLSCYPLVCDGGERLSDFALITSYVSIPGIMLLSLLSAIIYKFFKNKEVILISKIIIFAYTTIIMLIILNVILNLK